MGALTVSVRPGEAAGNVEAMERMLHWNDLAYRLAVRMLGTRESAEDVLQEAYLGALAHLKRNPPPDDERTWFLKVVSNAARRHRRGESLRRRKEATMRQASIDRSAPGDELVGLLRQAVNDLDEKYRVPLALCYEEGLSLGEAAAILEVPDSTLSDRLRDGLELLRKTLSKAGYAAAPAMVIGSLKFTAPSVPAGLAAALEKLVFGEAIAKGTGAAAVSAAAKGGLTVKIIVSVVAAGVLAGAVAVVNGVGAGLRPAPTALSSPPAAAPAQPEGKPAPVNDFKGMQEREEKFEFAQKPAVKKEGDKWIITFATTANCDATVSIVDKDGKIIRHLASGVLGVNAPYPFQQNSLAQKVEWDGLTDDFKKADAAGCKVKVSLGLQAKYDKSIGYDPACVPNPQPLGPVANAGPGGVLVGTGSDGLVYVATSASRWDTNCVAFDKDGKYVKTIIPPSGADMEKAAAATGMKLSTTKWGDKVLVCDWFGPFADMKAQDVVPKLVPGLALKPDKAPANLQSNKATGVGAWAGKISHLAVDRARDEIYAGCGGQARFIGKAGELDKTWFPDPKAGLTSNSSPCEASVGADGLVYIRFGVNNYGRHMIRLDHDGKPVPFKKENVVNVPGGEAWWNRLPVAFKGGIDAVFCGVAGHSFTHQSGLYAAPNGMIVMGIHEVDAKWAVAQGIVKQEQVKGPEISGNYNPVFDSDGKLLSANSVGETMMGQGVTMDRDGNLYTVYGGTLPEGQKTWDASDLPPKARQQAGSPGSLIKFRGQGGKFPLNQGEAKVKVSRGGKPFEVPGALWAYGGMSGQSGGDCQCHHNRFDMDFFARSFVPSTQLYSITVLDSNGNRVARFGRYGNVDDGEADLKSGKGDAIRFAWMRSVAASDAALYVVDPGNRRILRATLSYAAEETVPAP